MTASLIVLTVLSLTAVAAICATIVVTLRDGYRRSPSNR